MDLQHRRASSVLPPAPLRRARLFLQHLRFRNPFGPRGGRSPVSPPRGSATACEGNIAHVVVMPNVTVEKITSFVEDLANNRANWYQDENVLVPCIAKDIGQENCLCGLHDNQSIKKGIRVSIQRHEYKLSSTTDGWLGVIIPLCMHGFSLVGIECFTSLSILSKTWKPSAINCYRYLLCKYNNCTITYVVT